MSVQDLSQVTKFFLVCATGGVIGAFSIALAIMDVPDDPDMVLNYLELAIFMVFVGTLCFFYSFVPFLFRVTREQLAEKRKKNSKLSPMKEDILNSILALFLFGGITVGWSFYFFYNGGNDSLRIAFGCPAFQNALAKNENYISLNPEIQLMCEARIAKAHKYYKDELKKLEGQKTE